VAQLDHAGLLGPDMLHVHCNFFSDDELRRIADTGGTVVVTPETELQMAMEYPVTGRLLKVGIAPSLGIDIASDYAGDMFSQMRLAFQSGRCAISRSSIFANCRPPSARPSGTHWDLQP